MGKLTGHQQKSVYVDDSLYSAIKIIAAKTGHPIYVLFNDALTAIIEKHTTPQERKTLMSFAQKGQKNATKGRNSRGATTRKSKSAGKQRSSRGKR